MHIKHLAHGQGSAAKAAKYLTQESKAEVKTVLCGDPDMVAQVADSLNFKHKYTSGVIAWHRDDKPTPTQIREVVNAYEKMAFSGLQPDRYAFSAVQHTERDGSVHVHTFAARVDLETGKSYNPAPPGSLQHFDALRDYVNHEHQWKRPDSPSNARGLVPSHALPKDKQKAKQNITNGLLNMVEAGLIKDREDVLDAFKSGGFDVVRTTDKSISIADPNGGKNIRFKGTLYERHFNSQQAISRADEAQRAERSQDRDERVQELGRALTQAYKKRTEYNQQRYKRPDSPKPSPTQNAQQNAPERLQGRSSIRSSVGLSFDIGERIRNYRASKTSQNKLRDPRESTKSIRPQLAMRTIIHERIRNTTARITGTVKRAHDAIRERFKGYYEQAEVERSQRIEHNATAERLRQLQTRKVDKGIRSEHRKGPSMGF